MTNIDLSIGHTPNYARVKVGGLTIDFSYQTPIAFRDSEDSAVRVNVWSTTTGKHLNNIDGGNKAARIPGPEFEARLDAAIARLSIGG
ncbi:MAG: hypothetical protein M0R06_15530 [Sphaerochaeta sp.]|nr:hypothetical protein [Sphaerochaeta sp.]